jgi:AcrR family transcriptional regulator
MSPRKPAVLRDESGQNLRDYLIETAARLIDQRGSAGLAVRDIAREAQVADGVLYNYFEDKEDLLVHALLAHVGNVMASAPGLLPPPGEGTVAENLQGFIDGGVATLLRVTPAFAGLMSQPKVLARFHAMVGGNRAFEGTADDEASADGGDGTGDGAPVAGEAVRDNEPGDDQDGEAGRHEGQGLPSMLIEYLAGEQRLGRIDPAADIEAAASLIVGAMHGQVLPRVLFAPPGTPVAMPPGRSARFADIVLQGIAPETRHQ